MPAATRTLSIDFDGHRLAYRATGRGPAVVVIGQYWRPEDVIHVRLLADGWQLFHITPVGYGRSDRVPGYAGEALVDQVVAVLDHHGVDQFVIWGYSAGGAMAACVARATSRAAALVCGGFALLDGLTPGTMNRLDRRLEPNHASRSLWPWVNAFDWHTELDAMSCATLMYWGSDDHQMAAKLRRSRNRMFAATVDFVELPGLDHGTCNDAHALEHHIVPMLRRWIVQRVGRTW